MRRIFVGLTAAILAGSFCACAKNTPEPFDVSQYKRSTPAVLDATSEIEGCYTNGEYVVELICIDKKDGTCVHNLVLFTSDGGEQKFFGTLTGDLEGGEAAVAENLEEELSRIEVTSKQDEQALEICYTYNGAVVPGVCGEYKYLNEYRVPEKEEERVYIREGLYYCGEYRLSVSKKGNTMRFVITESEGRIVCEGMQTVGAEVQSVSLENRGTPLEIAAGLNEGKLYMEVAVYSENDDCEYAGVYETRE